MLNDIATLLELKGENPFKIRAYSNGARKLETLEEDLDELIAEGKLADIQGFGKALVEKNRNAPRGWEARILREAQGLS